MRRSILAAGTRESTARVSDDSPLRCGRAGTMKRLLFGATAGLLLAIAAQAAEIWRTLPQPPPLPQPRESGMAPVNGIRMYYALYGSGPPVLLIHGGLGHGDIWGFQVPAL